MEHHVDRMECPDEVTADTGTQVPFSHGVNNRNSTKAGGDQVGAGLRSASYTNNTLNQITGRGVPGAVDVIGVATPAAAVSVNGTTNGVYRRGDYFRRELSATNTSAPQWLTVGVTATSGPTNTVWPTGYVLVPPAGQTFQYDADGNITNDSVWSYTWDAENRLVQMTNTAAVISSARKKLVFQYDHQGRRIGKTVYPWGATDYSATPVLDNKFLYDNWNLLAELNATNNAVVRSCMWGLDLSGSEQGAGGVGGLLRLTYYGSSTTNAFVAHDGNGNVVALVDANGGTNVAEYIYGPFAEPLVVTGPMGKPNPFRFSTKYTDDETESLYYGYRYYSPSLGRWLNRDPIGEEGGVALLTFLRNQTVSSIDFIGLKQKKYNLTVPPCAILIVYGHHWPGNEKKPGLQHIKSIKPRDPVKRCAFAAVLACNASWVPNDIPLPGYSPVAGGLLTHHDLDRPNIADLDSEIPKVQKAAEEAAEVLCKFCCCKKVRIETESFGLTIFEWADYPAPSEGTYNCKSHTFSPDIM